MELFCPLLLFCILPEPVLPAGLAAALAILPMPDSFNDLVGTLLFILQFEGNALPNVGRLSLSFLRGIFTLLLNLPAVFCGIATLPDLSLTGFLSSELDVALGSNPFIAAVSLYEV